MSKVPISVVITLEKLRFAVILYCLARCLWFPQLADAFTKLTAKRGKPADFMLGTGPHPMDISLQCAALGRLLRTWVPSKHSHTENSWQEKGLVMCVAETVIFFRLGEVYCILNYSVDWFLVWTAAFWIILSRAEECIEDRLPYPCMWCQCLYALEILLLLLYLICHMVFH